MENYKSLEGMDDGRGKYYRSEISKISFINRGTDLMTENRK